MEVMGGIPKWYTIFRACWPVGDGPTNSVFGLVLWPDSNLHRCMMMARVRMRGMEKKGILVHESDCDVCILN